MSRGAGGDYYQLPARRKFLSQKDLNPRREEKEIDRALARLGFREDEPTRVDKVLARFPFLRAKDFRQEDIRIEQLKKQKALLERFLFLLEDYQAAKGFTLHEEGDLKIKKLKKELLRAEELYFKSKEESEKLLLLGQKKA